MQTRLARKPDGLGTPFEEAIPDLFFSFKGGRRLEPVPDPTSPYARALAVLNLVRVMPTPGTPLDGVAIEYRAPQPRDQELRVAQKPDVAAVTTALPAALTRGFAEDADWELLCSAANTLAACCTALELAAVARLYVALGLPALLVTCMEAMGMGPIVSGRDSDRKYTARATALVASAVATGTVPSAVATLACWRSLFRFRVTFPATYGPYSPQLATVWEQCCATLVDLVDPMGAVAPENYLLLGRVLKLFARLPLRFPLGAGLVMGALREAGSRLGAFACVPQHLWREPKACIRAVVFICRWCKSHAPVQDTVGTRARFFEALRQEGRRLLEAHPRFGTEALNKLHWLGHYTLDRLPERLSFIDECVVPWLITSRGRCYTPLSLLARTVTVYATSHPRATLLAFIALSRAREDRDTFTAPYVYTLFLKYMPCVERMLQWAVSEDGLAADGSACLLHAIECLDVFLEWRARCRKAPRGVVDMSIFLSRLLQVVWRWTPHGGPLLARLQTLTWFPTGTLALDLGAGPSHRWSPARGAWIEAVAR